LEKRRNYIKNIKNKKTKKHEKLEETTHAHMLKEKEH
jgi:hypothetical protein